MTSTRAKLRQAIILTVTDHLQCTPHPATLSISFHQSLFKKFATQSHSHRTAERASVESGKYMFHYLTEAGVCFLTLTEKGYPKKLVFQYLDELSGEFGRLYGTQVDTVTRPYAFIKFGEHGQHDNSECDT